MTTLYRDYADAAPGEPVLHWIVIVPLCAVVLVPWWVGVVQLVRWGIEALPW